MKRKQFRLLFVASVCLLLLSACSSKVKEELGLTRKSPDAFAVAKHAPLEMPPNYALRPPKPGKASPQEIQTEEQARTVIFGKTGKGKETDRLGTSEMALLKNAEADRAELNIREKIDHETDVLEPKEKSVSKRLLGFGFGRSEEETGSVIDATVEKERLKKRPLNE